MSESIRCYSIISYEYRSHACSFSFTIYQNTIAALVIVPLTYWLSVNYGITGGAVGWLAVNLGYVSISSLLIHRAYLRTEVKKWYLDNITLYAKTYFDMIKLAIAKK